MRLKISHRTEYRYDVPVNYALQRLRLVPRNSALQTVQAWTLAVHGAREEVRFSDQFDNDTRLISVDADTREIVAEASGIVDTVDKAGVLGEHRGFAPLWLFEHQTPLTAPAGGVRALVDGLGAGSELERLHRLMDMIAEKVTYRTGATHAGTTAEEALGQGSGVCQDHAHVFISAARLMGFPARYISGYLMMDGAVQQAASHAWAEAHVPMLGWVGFDPSNAMSPDERYVRLATGRDYRDAMPASGIRLGWAEERLAVSISVEQ